MTKVIYNNRTGCFKIIEDKKPTKPKPPTCPPGNQWDTQAHPACKEGGACYNECSNNKPCPTACIKACCKFEKGITPPTNNYKIGIWGGQSAINYLNLAELTSNPSKCPAVTGGFTSLYSYTIFKRGGEGFPNGAFSKPSKSCSIDSWQKFTVDIPTMVTELYRQFSAGCVPLSGTPDASNCLTLSPSVLNYITTWTKDDLELDSNTIKRLKGSPVVDSGYWTGLVFDLENTIGYSEGSDGEKAFRNDLLKAINHLRGLKPDFKIGVTFKISPKHKGAMKLITGTCDKGAISSDCPSLPTNVTDSWCKRTDDTTRPFAWADAQNPSFWDNIDVISPQLYDDAADASKNIDVKTSASFMINGTDYIPSLPNDSYNKLMWSVSANTTPEEVNFLQQTFGNSNRVYLANKLGCRANYFCGNSKADKPCKGVQCPFNGCTDGSQCYSCNEPGPPAPQLKMWIDRIGEGLDPTISMTTGDVNKTGKFNAILAFTGSMGLNITDPNYGADATVYPNTEKTDPVNTNWMADRIGNPGDPSFKDNMRKYFNVPDRYKSLSPDVYETDTKLWLNAYGGNTWNGQAAISPLSYMGNDDIAWLSQQEVLQELKDLGWHGLSIDVENINLGTDATKAADTIKNFFTQITNNGLLSAINTSTFGSTEALEYGFDQWGYPLKDLGINTNGLNTFITELGKYNFYMWNPQLYDAAGLKLLTESASSYNCDWAKLWTGPKIIAPLVPANLANTFEGANKEGSTSGGWVFIDQGSSRNNGRAGFGLWAEPSTISQDNTPIPNTPKC